jgi:hypothetical protein
VISSDQLEILKNFLGPTPYFWLITQLPDKAQEPFYFIQHFTQTLNAKTQTHLLDLLNNPLTRWAFGQLHFSNERNAQGDLILSTQAPGFDQYFFPGDSSFYKSNYPTTKAIFWLPPHAPFRKFDVFLKMNTSQLLNFR